jgi:hypothetical protein
VRGNIVAAAAGEDQPAGLAGDPHRGVADERDRRDQHHHEPDLIGVQRLPRSVAAVGQHRQQDQCHREQLEHGHQLVAVDTGQPPVQRRFDAEQQGGDDGACGGDLDITPDRHRTEGEGGHRGDDRGDAVIAGLRDGAEVGRDQDRRIGNESGGQDDVAEVF